MGYGVLSETMPAERPRQYPRVERRLARQVNQRHVSHTPGVSNGELDSDAALHLVRNYQHQPGVDRSRFVGRIRVTFRLGRRLVL